ncbi:MAG: acetyl-coenzyme A synthetase N-terminal domain-containing protein [Smithellaceae bacterium]
MKYAEIYKQSINNPDVFWGKAGEAIHWTRKWDKVLDDSGKPFYRWFAGGELILLRHLIATILYLLENILNTENMFCSLKYNKIALLVNSQATYLSG